MAETPGLMTRALQRRRALAAFAIVAGVATLGADTPPLDQEAIRRERAAARTAYDAGDRAAFLAHSRALAELAPRSATARYNLACALSLTGDAAGAVAELGRLAGWGVAFDLEAETDFDALRADPGFVAVSARMQALEQPVGDSVVAFTLPERDLLAEGVAHDPRAGSFFVTAVHRRKVVRVDGEGRARDFVGEGQDGLCSAQAAVADPARRSLFVSTGCSALMAGFRPEQAGRSSLLEYDLDQGKRRRLVPPPVAGGRVSDLSLGPDGTLYVSDDRTGRIYALAPDARDLAVVVEAGTLVSPQGLAVDPAGRVLFVSDYVQGLARVDVGTGRVTFLPAPDDVLLTGIDGLVLAGDSLVGIQNGITPHRIVRLLLDAERGRVVEAAVLERSHPLWDEPTLGVLVGGDLFYVANSQYRRFGGDGTPDLEHLQPPAIRRLRLPWMP